MVILQYSPTILAKTVQPLFEDPFDIASGGTSLTRATQEGILLSNPALLPYGGKFFRWLGIKTSVFPGKDSINLISSLGKGGDSTAALFANPIHIGLAQSVSVITSSGGLAAFTSFEPDLRVWKHGDPELGAGTPTIVFRNEAYVGLVGSLATRTPIKWLSLGASLKYLAASESRVAIDLTNPKATEEAQASLAQSQNPSNISKGIGFDASSLMFFQGDYVDYRLALTANNVGTTTLKGTTEKIAYKQTLNAGLGLTFHTNVDSLHFAIDFRDAGNAYGEELFKRVFLGVKAQVRHFIGVAVGVYHGTPTYGVEVDLFIFRLAATFYKREYGQRPGVDARGIYIASLSAGFTL